MNDVDKTVVNRLGLLADVQADRVDIRQGAAVKVKAAQVEARQAALAVVSSETAVLDGSSATIAISGDKTTLTQSAAGTVLSAGDVELDQCVVGGMAAKTVTARDSHSVFVVAGRVDGEVRSIFGVRESVAFGLAAGAALVLGAWLLPKAAVAVAATLATRRKRNRD